MRCCSLGKDGSTGESTDGRRVRDRRAVSLEIRGAVRLIMRMAQKTRQTETAETMAQKQREISVSEFFLKNRHLLGFDNPRKALLTTIKEGVDNALDACEEAGILPDVVVKVETV